MTNKGEMGLSVSSKLRGKQLKNCKLFYGDCLEVMKSIPNQSIDMVLTDPP